jgi:hypothetical protein
VALKKKVATDNIDDDEGSLLVGTHSRHNRILTKVGEKFELRRF